MEFTTLSVESKIENFTKVKDWLQSILNEIGSQGKQNNQLFIAIDEIFTNISKYACKDSEKGYGTVNLFSTFDKNDKIISQGEPMEDVVLILKGSATAENIDDEGNISILMRVKKNELYGLEAAFTGEKFYKDSLVANEKTFVMFMNKHRLITPCENRCKRHEIVIKHVTQILADRNAMLLDKLNHMSKKTIREKLLSYFKTLASEENSYFDLPFNKTELASYLGVDRSAMCAELKRMKDDEIIDYEKRSFRLIKRN